MIKHVFVAYIYFNQNKILFYHYKIELILTVLEILIDFIMQFIIHYLHG